MSAAAPNKLYIAATVVFSEPTFGLSIVHPTLEQAMVGASGEVEVAEYVLNRTFKAKNVVQVAEE